MSSPLERLRALAKEHGLLAPLLTLEEEADAREMECDELRVQLKQQQLAARDGGGGEELHQTLSRKEQQIDALEDEKSELKIALGELKSAPPGSLKHRDRDWELSAHARASSTNMSE